MSDNGLAHEMMVAQKVISLNNENDKLRAELEQAYEKLRYALAALEAGEWELTDDGYGGEIRYCPWCDGERDFGGHELDCQRQLVLQMQPLKVGEK